jgi:hypothetical protein
MLRRSEVALLAGLFLCGCAFLRAFSGRLQAISTYRLVAGVSQTFLDKASYKNNQHEDP